MGKVIVVNIEKCLGCRSCEIACAVAHSESKVLEEAICESPKSQRRLTVEAVAEFAVPLQCRHCEDAPCIAVCPTGAICRHGAEDPVLINAELCIGCKFCLMACPFGVINVSRDGKAMVKCDLCVDRTESGGQPACVEACPTSALKVADEKELAADKRKYAAGEAALSVQQDNYKQKQKENKQ